MKPLAGTKYPRRSFLAASAALCCTLVALVVAPTELWAQADAPAVSAVVVTSDPGADDTYATGDVIEVTVTFDSAVTVSGAPQVALGVGGETRQAAFRSGTGSDELIFSYTVAAGDEDTNGIEVPDNGLTPNGGSIRGRSADAVLTFARVHTPASHRVDGIAPEATLLLANSGTTAFAGWSTYVYVRFDEPIPEGVLAIEDFTVANAELANLRFETHLEDPNGHWSYYYWGLYLSPLLEGEATIQLRSGTVVDEHGNGNPSSNVLRVTAAGRPVTVTADADAVTEGEAAIFTLTRTNSTSRPLTVELEITETGDVTDGQNGYGTVQQVEIAAGAESTTFSVSTVNDDSDETAGVITLHVLDTNAYDVGDPGAASVNVIDDDLPFVAMETTAASADEGDAVTFTLTREGDLTVPLTIPGDRLRSHTYPPLPGTSTVDRDHPVTFPQDVATVILSVAPEDDDVYFVYRQLNVRLDTGNADLFRLRQPDSAAASQASDSTTTLYELPVPDNDPVRISVAVDEPLITEADGPTCFVFSSDVVFHPDPIRWSTFSFTVAIGHQGDYLIAAPTNRTLMLTFSTVTTDLCLPLDDDDEAELAGSVTVEVSQTSVRFVASHGATDVAAEGAAAKVVVVDDDLPYLTIAADVTAVDEGGSVVFTLTRSGLLEQPLHVTPNHLFAGVEKPVGFHLTFADIQFAPDEKTRTFTVSVPDDDLYFASQVMYVQLLNPPGDPLFNVPLPLPEGVDEGSGPNALLFRIPIIDNDRAEVWVEAVVPSVDESEQACFQLGTDAIIFAVSVAGREFQVPVNISVAQHGNYLEQPAGPRTEVMTAQTHDVCLALHDDAATEPNGSVSVTVVAGTAVNYVIANPPDATVEVRDDDGPTVTIEAAEPAEEGGNLSVTFKRSGRTPRAVADRLPAVLCRPDRRVRCFQRCVASREDRYHPHVQWDPRA